MEFLKATFSFHGRVGRGDFWFQTFLLIAALVLVWATYALRLPGGGILATVLFLLGFAAWASGIVRRLHDRDKSAWYLLLFFGVPSVLQSYFKGSSGDDTLRIYFFSGGLGGAIDLICLAISIWMIVELGLLGGTPGDNNYGPGPGVLSVSEETPPPIAIKSETD